MTEAVNVSDAIAQFVAAARYEDLPARTIDMAKRCVLDALGVSLAASGLGEGCRAFLELGLEGGSHGQCTVIGTGYRLPPEAAAFANGSMAHAMDYEDAHDGTLLHPNAPAVPAALAIAEAFGPVSGKDLMTSIAVGCEVSVRLGLALRVSLVEHGFYPPPIIAAFGATASAAKLLRLNANQIRDAFSLTLCQAVCSGEIKYSPDSVIRAVRDAFAARAAVSSALLAGKGVTGFDYPFEGRAGFFTMFARSLYEPGDLLNGLGRTFHIEDISFKPWPSCRGTHAAIEAMLELRRRHGFTAADVKSIELRAGKIMRMLDEPAANKRRPATAIDAKFSLPFTVAAALVHGRVALEEFFPAALGDARVLDAASKVSLDIDSSRAGNDIGCQVRVTTVAGASYSTEVAAPLGHPGNPMSELAFQAKFVDCARYAAQPLSEAQATRLFEAVLNLETVKDIRTELMPLLTATQNHGMPH